MASPPGTPWWISALVIGAIATVAVTVWLRLDGDGARTHDPTGSSSDRPAPGEPRTGAAPVPMPEPPRAGSRPQRAAALVAAARAAAASGDLAKAREQLIEAYELAPSSITLLELARVDFQTGHCRDARRAVQVVLDAAPGGSLADEARELVGRIGRCD